MRVQRICCFFNLLGSCNFVALAGGYRCKITKWDEIVCEQTANVRLLDGPTVIKTSPYYRPGVSTPLGGKFKFKHKTICFC